MYFNIGGGSKLPGSSIDTTVNRLARYNFLVAAVGLSELQYFSIYVRQSFTLDRPYFVL